MESKDVETWDGTYVYVQQADPGMHIYPTRVLLRTTILSEMSGSRTLRTSYVLLLVLRKAVN